MKVTEASTYRLMNTNLDRITNTLQDLRNIGATGLKLNEASDDVSAIRPVITTRTEIRSADRYIETMGVSLDKMEATDGYLDQVENILQRVKEIGITAVNGSLSDADFETLADEVTQLKEEMLDAANAMIDGKYVFSGYQENTIPFVENPDYDPDLWDASNPNTWPYLYQGDNNPTNLEITPGELIEVNITGNDLFFGISNATIDSGIPTEPPLTGIQQGTTMTGVADTFTITAGGVTTTIDTTDTSINYAQQIADAMDSDISGNTTGLSVTVNASSTEESGELVPTTDPYTLTVNGMDIASAPATSAYQLDYQIDSFIQSQIEADPTSAGGSIADGDAWFYDTNGTLIEINGSAQSGDLSFRAADGADITVTETTTPGTGFTSASYNNSTTTTYGTIDIGTNSADSVVLAGSGLASVGLTAATLDPADQYPPDSGRLDLFSALTRMEEALRAGNVDDPDGAGGGVSQNIENLEIGADQERRIRSRLGNRAARVEDAQDYQEEVKVDLEQILSRYQDADVIEIFNEIVQQETAYQAALNITSRVSQITILDYF